jgi:trimethylamine--corrinoid protein Co-methyltransferase
VVHAVGPGGNFLGEDHTLNHFREFWQPALFDRQRFDGWKSAGSKNLGARLKEQTLAIMDSHPGSPLPDKLAREVEKVLGL